VKTLNVVYLVNRALSFTGQFQLLHRAKLICTSGESGGARWTELSRQMACSSQRQPRAPAAAQVIVSVPGHSRSYRWPPSWRLEWCARDDQ
jgi:hypothetical protein